MKQPNPCQSERNRAFDDALKALHFTRAGTLITDTVTGKVYGLLLDQHDRVAWRKSFARMASIRRHQVANDHYAVWKATLQPGGKAWRD